MPPEAVTILLVDDEQTVRALVGRLLRREGYRVIEGNDAPDALRTAENHPEFIHLLLTDIDMPGMNGLELAHRLQQLRPRLKILFMSGLVVQSDLDGQPFIGKPFTIAQLSDMVKSALNPDGSSSGTAAPPHLRLSS
jgi:CheY-like chemotaxis protein